MEDVAIEYDIGYIDDDVWNKFWYKYSGDPKQLEEEIIKRSEKPKPKPKEKLPLYKSVDLTPFRKLYNEHQVSEAYQAYAKALGIRPISIAIIPFRKLIKS